MIFADAVFARRLETAEAAIARACRSEGSPPCSKSRAAAPSSPARTRLSRRLSPWGLSGPVKARLNSANWRSFFAATRVRRPRIDLCPLADPGFVGCALPPRIPGRRV